MLFEAGSDNPSNESRWLLENILGLSTGKLMMTKDEPAEPEYSELFFSKIRERIAGRPLQYIIGRWDFYGREFFVGEGVLIPRPETEQLVELALDYIAEINNPCVLDLCAGTGCIGLTVAKERPDSEVCLVEKYEGAFEYLKKNAQKLGAGNAALIQGDIFNIEEMPEKRFDLIVSNPPYIPASEIQTLSREVKNEPHTALDGGSDGLKYYYAIRDISRRYGGCAVIVECGDGQADSVCRILGSARSYKDFNSIDRFVIGD